MRRRLGLLTPMTLRTDVEHDHDGELVPMTPFENGADDVPGAVGEMHTRFRCNSCKTVVEVDLTIIIPDVRTT